MEVLSNSITKDFIKHKEDINLFNENLKKIRKEKGYTQEELAAKVGVVRQTVSKWEKGLSVPDADILRKLAEILNTDINILLGNEIAVDVDNLNGLIKNEEKDNKDNSNSVEEQLTKISEQLDIKNKRNRKIWKTIGFVLVAIVVFNIFLVLFNVTTSKSISTQENTVTIETETEEETN